MISANRDDLQDSPDVAVIGIAGRFPKAGTVQEFWRNLCDGVESISFYSDEELLSFGFDQGVVQDPNFVKAASAIENFDKFDASFFGYSPREAELLDPQHRIFLECAWEALESAGCDPDRYPGLIGVYAGSSLSSYLLYNLLADPSVLASNDTFPVMVSNDKDFLTTRASYELNLRGPSITVQTGCSTSLVAVHLAWEGLLSYQCDVALAGGISVQVPRRRGYHYQQGGALSPDGHCRAFDAMGQGTVFGSGAGIVVLKRLNDAIKDGNTIHAVIRGSAVNNDGRAKIGYTAPGVEGQATAIRMAQEVAGISADSITMIEAHGTATPLGDPIEVAALTRAFRATTDRMGYCAIGSVKTNVGHLDAAAGIMGLIKTVLALEHKMLPPSLHFDAPNPKIDFETSPFFVNTRLSEWRAPGSPRRAGVSSFGIGGTNAHVIVEEAPPMEQPPSSRSLHLVLLSAKTPSALDLATSNLARHVRDEPALCLADLAYTLQTGRKRFSYRRTLVTSDREDLYETLSEVKPGRVWSAYNDWQDPEVVFMFPGGGAQYSGMGAGIYKSEEVFRRHFDECCEILRPLLGLDLRQFLLSENSNDASQNRLRRSTIALSSLLAIEYSLARLWIKLGVRPHAMIGHSLGEYTAACLAGVFSLEDALHLVSKRGQLLDSLPRGAMISVALSEGEVCALIDGRLSLAAINAPRECVVSGTEDAVQEFEGVLGGKGIDFRRLGVARAGHSSTLATILDEFAECVEEVELRPPTIPFISNVSGTWINEGEATDPAYWVKHFAAKVRFCDGLRELTKEDGRVYLEVGPGLTLSTLARLQVPRAKRRWIFGSMRDHRQRGTDDAFLLEAVCRLWLAGVEVDWAEFYRDEHRRLIELPTYPFERQRFWIQSANTQRFEPTSAQATKADIADWFYFPAWKQTVSQARSPDKLESETPVLLFLDSSGLGREVADSLKAARRPIITVLPSHAFRRLPSGDYLIRKDAAEDYQALIKDVSRSGERVIEIVHLWSLETVAGPPLTSLRTSLDVGFYSLLYLTRALQSYSGSAKIWVVSDGMASLEGSRLRPEKAMLLGPCKVIPQEMESVSCHCIDVVIPEQNAADTKRIAQQVMVEISSGPAAPIVAYRGNARWVQRHDPVQLQTPDVTCRTLRQKGAYLVVGGLGGVGFLIAEHLARTVSARLVLTGRTYIPARSDWDSWLSNHSGDDPTTKRIRKIRTLEEAGAVVLPIVANASDEQQMRLVLARTTEMFGDVNGVIHAAGYAGQQTVKMIEELDQAECEKHFTSRAYGLLALEGALTGMNPDFCLLISSNVSVLGGLGAFAYSAATCFMDGFASSRADFVDPRWISVNWDGWLMTEDSRISAFQTSMDRYAMKPSESIEALRRILDSGVSGRIVVSSGELDHRIREWVERDNPQMSRESNADRGRHRRPALETAYVPPADEIERTIAEIWRELLGIEEIGAQDNFFELGGNSLIGLKVLSRLRSALNIALPVVALFEGPTVTSLADVIRKSGADRPTYDDDFNRGKRRRERRLARSTA
jgi:phthiocerol/phenolphthiocerol synthesis type-I polyketide synthase E